jgi:hypothetical protein
MLPNMTARQIPVFGWKTITSRARHVGWMMTSSSSNTTRAWLDHLLRNTIDNWEDLKENFNGSYQATYLPPGNP